jgi:hypothetical protein
MSIQSWTKDHLYSPGDLVQHGGRKWVATSSNQNNQPDDVPGDWEDVSEASNLDEFIAIKDSLDSYEARVTAHQAAVAAAKKSAEAKLTALGLTTEELQALGLRSSGAGG